MKKILSITFILLLSATPAFSQILYPEWSDFCPPKYIETQPGKASLLSFFYKVRRENARKTYWYERKQDFFKKSAFCNNTESQELKAQCYRDLTQIQLIKNNSYYAEESAKNEARKSQLIINAINNLDY